MTSKDTMEKLVIMKTLLMSAVFGLLFIVHSLAHSPLEATIPADGERLAKPAKTIGMVFSKPARITKLVLEHPENGEMRLSIPVRDFIKKATIDADIAAKGAYLVHWRAMSDDGHALKGSFAFTLD